MKTRDLAITSERRNFRRAVVALSLIALAALGRAANSAESADHRLVISVGCTGDLSSNSHVATDRMVASTR